MTSLCNYMTYASVSVTLKVDCQTSELQFPAVFSVLLLLIFTVTFQSHLNVRGLDEASGINQQ